MKTWSDFEKLAEMARGEQSPAVDVTAKVVAHIQGCVDRSGGVAPGNRADLNRSILRLDADEDRIGLLLGAAIAVAAASVALMLSLPTQETLSDPLAGWLQAYQVVLQ